MAALIDDYTVDKLQRSGELVSPDLIEFKQWVADQYPPFTHEVFQLSPTAYDTERQRQEKQTAKQRAREGQKQLKIAISGYALALRNGTTGMQHARLQHVDRVAAQYEIELDVYFRWMLALYEAAESEKVPNG